METRPEYTEVFTEDENTIRERLLSNVPDTWRKEKGDFPYDMVIPSTSEILQLEMQQDDILRNSFPQFCDDEYMDEHMERIGLTRVAATANRRKLRITADVGVRIPKGYTLTSIVLDEDDDPIEFTTDNDIIFVEDGVALEVPVTCVITGEQGNIATGSDFTLQPPIPGVETITDLGTTVAAADIEDVNSAWFRYKEKVENPDTGGNINDYRRWVANDFYEDRRISIGKVLVQMCWDKSNGLDGRGTVRVICAGSDYKPISEDTITELQNYLDPEPHGYGYGKAPGGAIVTVITGVTKLINVSATVKCSSAVDKTYIQQQYRKKLEDYIHSLVFEEDPETLTLYPIDYSKVGALLGNIEGVDGYTNVLVNGGAADVPMDYFDIPEVGTVVIN